jgi:hypothetical protein
VHERKFRVAFWREPLHTACGRSLPFIVMGMRMLDTQSADTDYFRC